MSYNVLVWYIKARCTCLLTYCTYISAWLPSCALTRKCSITNSFPQIALQPLKSRCSGCRPQKKLNKKTHLATVFYHSLWFHNYLAKRVYDLIWVANVPPPPLSFPPLSVVSGGNKYFVHRPVIIPYLQCFIWMPSEMWPVEPYVDLITVLSWWLIPTLPSHRIINKDGITKVKKWLFLTFCLSEQVLWCVNADGKCNEIEIY